ncbi:Serine/threonine protein kinase [Handroanthus impetiginosus]|uniref:Receptor-like serine/threonine-protein kinase n=1 Tax=Handroanthus impetiginosus TaxID=429701 RepID=A0A2G9HBA5_9LAMI|nr:Serine/threonine protein kinase [Handroanthus impetiginosus]
MSSKLRLFLVFLCSNLTCFCNGLDTITPGQFISGNQTLISKNGTFELGFFTPDRVVVWVANREHPVSDPSSSELRLLQQGNLVLLNNSKDQVWSTNSTSGVANSTVLVLLDSGNLVIRYAFDSSNVLWQSFDYPIDHWLPGGKIGSKRLKNLKQKLTSWRSARNSAPSLYSVEVEANGTSHVLLWNKTKLYWSTGDWNGKIFKFIPEIGLNFYIKNLRYVVNDNESYFTYKPGVPGALTRFLIYSTGQLKQFVWGKNFTRWTIFWTRPSQQCEVYSCWGAFSSCSKVDMPPCKCLPGYEPTDPKNWGFEDHTDGCKPRKPLQCESDTFSVISKTHLPDGALVLPFGDVEDCRLGCLRNCTCTAHAFDDDQCLHWVGDLINMLQLPSDDATGKEIFVRVSASSRSKTLWIVVGTTVGISIVVIMILLIIWSRRRNRETSEPVEDSLVLYKHRNLRSATRNFSEKLGEGGFGCVFKGTLRNSSVIAVKRLKYTNQEKQLWAEVRTLGTIQHINLVHLKGFCVQDLTRFLVYEYMINGSLDSKLFPKDSTVLDWKTRYEIAIGTARGLAYLHENCRDCIIHCDVKLQNILLDDIFNPKIADFGLAKLIGREFSRVLTTIRGTRGYLAPEWISGEPITTKADVFSYGMVLMEIVSGQRNRDSFSEDGSGGYFPAHVVKRINEGHEIMSLLDGRLEVRADEEEVRRACKVACWCIQDEERNRPSMGRIVQVLTGLLEMQVFPMPKFLQGFVDDEIDPVARIGSSSSSTS